MKKLKYIGILVLAILFTACKGADPACKEEKAASALVKDFPDTMKVGQEIELEVQYIIENSCGEFKEWDVVQHDSVFTIKMMTEYQGCNCALQFEDKSEFYTLKFSEVGHYTHKFWVAENEYDAYTVVVAE